MSSREFQSQNTGNFNWPIGSDPPHYKWVFRFHETSTLLKVNKNWKMLFDAFQSYSVAQRVFLLLVVLSSFRISWGLLLANLLYFSLASWRIVEVFTKKKDISGFMYWNYAAVLLLEPIITATRRWNWFRSFQYFSRDSKSIPRSLN